MLVESNEYPDPDYTPHFLWHGSKNSTIPSDEIHDDCTSPELITSDVYAPYFGYQRDIPFPKSDQQRRDSNQHPSIDPDFQLQSETER